MLEGLYRSAGLGTHPEELDERVEEREDWPLCLGYCPHDPNSDKWKLMDGVETK